MSRIEPAVHCRTRIVLFVAAVLGVTGCGFGFGGIYGPKNYPAGTIATVVWDDPWCRFSCSGTRYTSRYDASTSKGGMLVGVRTGLSWARAGDAKIEDGRSTDGHLTGYYGLFSLGLGYTSDRGRLDGTSDVGYSGFFIEPGVGISIGPLYTAFTLAVISGETSLKHDSNLSTARASGTGYRPGGRVALGLFTKDPVTFKLVVDVRYLMTPDSMLFGGGGASPESYGGWSAVFGIMATM